MGVANDWKMVFFFFFEAILCGSAKLFPGALSHPFLAVQCKLNTHDMVLSQTIAAFSANGLGSEKEWNSIC